MLGLAASGLAVATCTEDESPLPEPVNQLIGSSVDVPNTKSPDFNEQEYRVSYREAVNERG